MRSKNTLYCAVRPATSPRPRAKERNSEAGLTDRQDGSEDGRVLDGGAIPSVVPELELAFADPVPRAPADVHHVVRVQHAKLLLSR